MGLPPGAPRAGAASTLSDADYHRLTDTLLARLEAAADRWLEEDDVDVDSQRTGGLLELRFPDGGKVVVNPQPPLHEMWLAARDGGYHFRWDGEQWRDTRDGTDFEAVFLRIARTHAGRALAL